MKKVVTILLVIVVLTASLCVYASNLNEDAIITLGYFNKQLDSFKTEFKEEIVKLIGEKIKEAEENKDEEEEKKDEPISNSGNIYEIVTVTSGKKVIFGASTEFVLRRGTATIVDPSKEVNPGSPNGVPNLTNGKDSQHGNTVDLQNLYMIPREDGRGILAKTELTIMIRGKYEIK